MTKRFRVGAALIALALSSGGCVVANGGGPPPRGVHRSGPPPHAPAHGYRHRHGGHDLVFDSGLGVYAVVDLRDVWFLDGSYFRISGDHFEISVGATGPWRVAEVRRVSSRLYEKRHPHGGPPGQAKKKGKHKR